MTGGLLVQALVREVGDQVLNELANELQKRHAEIYAKSENQSSCFPVPEVFFVI